MPDRRQTGGYLARHQAAPLGVLQAGNFALSFLLITTLFAPPREPAPPRD